VDVSIGGQETIKTSEVMMKVYEQTLPNAFSDLTNFIWNKEEAI
jgi:hypothetical protein